MISHASAAEDSSPPPRCWGDACNFSRLNLTPRWGGEGWESVLCDDVWSRSHVSRSCTSRIHHLAVYTYHYSGGVTPSAGHETVLYCYTYAVATTTIIIIIYRRVVRGRRKILFYAYTYNIVYIYIGKQPAAGNLFEIFRARRTSVYI